MDKSPTTLSEQFPKEQARLRKLSDLYATIGTSGIFAKATIDDCLGRAEIAAISGNLVAILIVYQEMKGFE